MPVKSETVTAMDSAPDSAVNRRGLLAATAATAATGLTLARRWPGVGQAAADCTVRLVTDQGGPADDPAAHGGSGRGGVAYDPAHAAYVRAEIRHAPAPPGLPGAFAALTNPVFLDARAGTAGREAGRDEARTAERPGREERAWDREWGGARGQGRGWGTSCCRRAAR
ncbi:hypothetical protein GCM10010231_22920 [Streptomyces sindenensis]|nr:hypothetical protein GCM10010231_22920 [Streptomyces sindenensis]